MVSGPVLAALVLAGCSSGPDPADPTNEVVQPSDGSANVSKIADVYAKFDFRACQKDHSCARTFSMRAGFDLGTAGTNAVPNPRAKLKSNPDPLWIPEWNRLPEGDNAAHYAYEAMALAAIHKTYRLECERAYAAYNLDTTKKLDALDKEIAAKNREPNPYDRLGGLLAIQPPKPSSTLHEFAVGSDGLRYRWEAALFEAFEDTKRTFVYTFDGYAPSDALLAVLHPRQPAEYELDAFCMVAATGGIVNVPPLPETSSWDSGVKSMVRRFVPDERASQIVKRRAELADVTKAKFAKAKIANPQLPSGVVEIPINKVATFSRDGKKAIVTSVVTREDKQKMPNGSLKTIKSDESATATFEDWPSNVNLEPGDSVTFYGAEVSVKELTLKSTPELEHKSRTYVLEGKHVTKITAKGKTTVYFK